MMRSKDDAPSGPPQLIFAGGGTGGHIYPALAIAEQAREIDPEVGTHFVVSKRPVDASILDPERVAYTPIPACPPIGKPIPALRFALSWIPAVRATKRVLRMHEREGPTVLVAMGGFVCAPAVAAAQSMRLPVVLVNLDAVPGKANRHVSRHAERVWSACATDQNWDEVGPIVRKSLTDIASPMEARKRFGLDASTRTFLVTGGSQGAKSINDLMLKLLADHHGSFDGWQAIHQTGGQHDPAPIRVAYERAGIRAWTDRYIGDMPGAWAAADLSIGRCGAGTVAEAWATRTPAVFFPYPYHADDHQRHNARPLARLGAALVLDDHVEPAKNALDHGSTILALLTDPSRLDALREPALRLPPVDGAAQIARCLTDRLRSGHYPDDA
ncbi:MAG: glycosyltransferase [Phycisphaerales bacterium]